MWIFPQLGNVKYTEVDVKVILNYMVIFWLCYRHLRFHYSVDGIHGDDMPFIYRFMGVMDRGVVIIWVDRNVRKVWYIVSYLALLLALFFNLLM